ncbi:MAG: transposase [Patescibacteria group bacterium]
MNRKFKFSIGEFYHIYNRGNEKRIIFKDDHDRKRFTDLLFLCNTKKSIVVREIPTGLTYEFDRGETIVDIGAYCLMPNHFHLLLREKTENGISLFMKKLATSYSMYFNKRHQRTGGLFEGKFKATHVDSDTYLKYLFSYIHLNPVKIIDPHWKENGINDKDMAEKYLDFGLDLVRPHLLSYSFRFLVFCFN